MKTRSTFYSIFFAATSLLLLSHCDTKKTEEAANEHDGHEHAVDPGEAKEASAPQFQVDHAFQGQLAAVFTSYVKLKDALVASDAAKVKTEASETKQALANVDMKLLTGAAHHDWMTYLAPMQSSINEIESASDLEDQRKSFSTLSDNLYKSAKAFGLGGKEAFYEYCPMAFNNEGAYWLSDQDEIRNPYFGDKMLTCGVVQEKLK